MIKDNLQNDDSEINEPPSIEIENNFNANSNMVNSDITNSLQRESSELSRTIENFDNLDFTGYTYNTTSISIFDNCSLRILSQQTFQKDDENKS